MTWAGTAAWGLLIVFGVLFVWARRRWPPLPRTLRRPNPAFVASAGIAAVCLMLTDDLLGTNPMTWMQYVNLAAIALLFAWLAWRDWRRLADR